MNETANDTIRLTVVWNTRNGETIRRIRERFGLPSGMSINRETPATVRKEDMGLLEECARRGFIGIRYKGDGR